MTGRCLSLSMPNFAKCRERHVTDGQILFAALWFIFLFNCPSNPCQHLSSFVQVLCTKLLGRMLKSLATGDEAWAPACRCLDRLRISLLVGLGTAALCFLSRCSGEGFDSCLKAASGCSARCRCSVRKLQVFTLQMYCALTRPSLDTAGTWKTVFKKFTCDMPSLWTRQRRSNLLEAAAYPVQP